jgi:hypothetical protein
MSISAAWTKTQRIVNAMGRFYAAKLRAALVFEIWMKTHDPKAGALALAQ